MKRETKRKARTEEFEDGAGGRGGVEAVGELCLERGPRVGAHALPFLPHPTLHLPHHLLAQALEAFSLISCKGGGLWWFKCGLVVLWWL